MALGRLTAIKVQREVTPGRYSDGGNLYLFVRGDGGRVWTFRYKAATGRQREMALGAVADITLSEAREKARDARRLLDAGTDPIDARSTAKREAIGLGNTFREISALYIKAHEDGWKNAKHRSNRPTRSKPTRTRSWAIWLSARLQWVTFSGFWSRYGGRSREPPHGFAAG